MANLYPLEQILELDIEKYLENKGKELGDYIIKGVTVECVVPSSINRRFQMEVPTEAEVVVNYHRELYGNHDSKVPSGANAYGMALIPK